MKAIAEVVGIDHIYLTVSSLDRSEQFYDRLLGDVLGFRKSRFTLGGEAHLQYYNRLLGIVLRPARRGAVAHHRYTPGLHHLCLRVATPRDVDLVATALEQSHVRVSIPRRYPEYAPDYYAVFLEDPDGVQLEITNFRDERKERMYRWDDAG